jgi:hypothetical protein
MEPQLRIEVEGKLQLALGRVGSLHFEPIVNYYNTSTRLFTVNFLPFQVRGNPPILAQGRGWA